MTPKDQTGKVEINTRSNREQRLSNAPQTPIERDSCELSYLDPGEMERYLGATIG